MLYGTCLFEKTFLFFLSGPASENCEACKWLFFSWSINSLNHLQQQHPSSAQQQSPQQPRTGTGWKPTLLGAGSFERCHGWKSQMHQALLLRRNRVPMERFTFSWRCSWGTVCWHMLSYVELCSGMLRSVIYFRSCHWCVDAIEKDRKNTSNLLGWRWNFYNKKHNKSATAGSVMSMWFQDIPTASYWFKSSSQIIRPPVIKKKLLVADMLTVFFDVFWGLVSFPKVCKKPPSYNHFQRKTTHPNHWALQRFGAAAVAQRGSPGNEGKFPTQHIRGTWMHWGVQLPMTFQ